MQYEQTVSGPQNNSNFKKKKIIIITKNNNNNNNYYYYIYIYISPFVALVLPLLIGFGVENSFSLSVIEVAAGSSSILVCALKKSGSLLFGDGGSFIVSMCN